MRRTRKHIALGLLEDAERGPNFSMIGTVEMQAEFAKCYRIWATTWLLPDLVRLIPELKGATISQPGTSKPYEKDAA